MYDVLIIGAGIEGTAIARRLSRYALSIALVEAANDAGMPKRMPSSRAGSATRAASSLRSSTRS